LTFDDELEIFNMDVKTLLHEAMYSPSGILWSGLLSVCKTVRTARKNPQELPDPSYWPIDGLVKRATDCTQSISILAAQGLWPDALILTRVLFEIDVVVSWLTQKDTSARIERYIAGINQEKEKLAKKMDAGMSIAAKMLAELIGKSGLDIRDNENSQQRNWSGMNIRDMSNAVDLEGSYDIPYWHSSIFAHSHVLSVLCISGELASQEKQLRTMFSWSKEGWPCKLVLMGTPAIILHIFEVADPILQLGLKESTCELRKALNSALTTATKGMFSYSSDVSPGEIQVVYDDDSVSSVSANRRQSQKKAKNRRKKK
jgi:hypothetical protein